jgi:hypothetical protein
MASARSGVALEDGSLGMARSAATWHMNRSSPVAWPRPKRRVGL